MLAALQSGIPITRHPFEELARELGCGESELIEVAAEALREGRARRFGAVFDTRRLGFSTTLCCAETSDPDAAAAFLVPRREVTHCYRREAPGCPNLWWTWSAPAETFEASLAEIPFPFHSLPATRRYKVDVVFGGATRALEESTIDNLPPPDEKGRRIICALQGETEVRPDYFEALAEKIGLREWDLLATLEVWRRQGRLKRIGLLLDHRKSGYTANGMCCFRLAGETQAAGRALAALNEVTHCYERPLNDAFPYNLFAMVHGTSVEEANRQFDLLKSCLSALDEPPAAAVMLLSTKEYKKTSISYYRT
jgi:DNA-binding Lrp family transcriptional regulator